MRRRALGPAVHGFLDTIREGHPTKPLALITPLLCPIREDTPGPSALDPEAPARGEVRFVATGDPDGVASGELTLRVIREVLKTVVEQRQDSLLSFLHSTYEAAAVAGAWPRETLEDDPALRAAAC